MGFAFAVDATAPPAGRPLVALRHVKLTAPGDNSRHQKFLEKA
jgi:hypothetical protein